MAGELHGTPLNDGNAATGAGVGRALGCCTCRPAAAICMRITLPFLLHHPAIEPSKAGAKGGCLNHSPIVRPNQPKPNRGTGNPGPKAPPSHGHSSTWLARLKWRARQSLICIACVDSQPPATGGHEGSRHPDALAPIRRPGAYQDDGSWRNPEHGGGGTTQQSSEKVVSDRTAPAASRASNRRGQNASCRY
jgi:hypothetical protein